MRQRCPGLPPAYLGVHWLGRWARTGQAPSDGPGLDGPKRTQLAQKLQRPRGVDSRGLPPGGVLAPFGERRLGLSELGGDIPTTLLGDYSMTLREVIRITH